MCQWISIFFFKVDYFNSIKLYKISILSLKWIICITINYTWFLHCFKSRWFGFHLFVTAKFWNCLIWLDKYTNLWFFVYNLHRNIHVIWLNCDRNNNFFNREDIMQLLCYKNNIPKHTQLLISIIKTGSLIHFGA